MRAARESIALPSGVRPLAWEQAPLAESHTLTLRGREVLQNLAFSGLSSHLLHAMAQFLAAGVKRDEVFATVFAQDLPEEDVIDCREALRDPVFYQQLMHQLKREETYRAHVEHLHEQRQDARISDVELSKEILREVPTEERTTEAAFLNGHQKLPRKPLPISGIQRDTVLFEEENSPKTPSGFVRRPSVANQYREDLPDFDDQFSERGTGTRGRS